MTDVATMANAITTAIQTGLAATQSSQSVILSPFEGKDTDDFRTFKEQITSSVALANVPEASKLDYLKLHLSGGALAYYLELPNTSRNTFDNAIGSLETRYLSPNRIELFKLKFQERKYNQSRESAEDYLTDITRLANIAFPDATGVNRSAERTRRIRDAFISGMPNSIRLKLLLEPDNKTVQELCTFVSKRQALQTTLPDEDATTTAFNNVAPASSQMSDALNSIVNTEIGNKELEIRN